MTSEKGETNFDEILEEEKTPGEIRKDLGGSLE